MTHLKSDSFIEINLDMDELDLTAAECKATYQKIKDYIQDNYGYHIPSLYIAQIKRKLGIDIGVNYNLSKKDSHSVPQCPPEKELMIIDALKHFRMI